MKSTWFVNKIVKIPRILKSLSHEYLNNSNIIVNMYDTWEKVCTCNACDCFWMVDIAI